MPVRDCDTKSSGDPGIENSRGRKVPSVKSTLLGKTLPWAFSHRPFYFLFFSFHAPYSSRAMLGSATSATNGRTLDNRKRLLDSAKCFAKLSGRIVKKRNIKGLLVLFQKRIDVVITLHAVGLCTRKTIIIFSQ